MAHRCPFPLSQRPRRSRADLARLLVNSLFCRLKTLSHTDRKKREQHRVDYADHRINKSGNIVVDGQHLVRNEAVGQQRAEHSKGHNRRDEKQSAEPKRKRGERISPRFAVLRGRVLQACQNSK